MKQSKRFHIVQVINYGLGIMSVMVSSTHRSKSFMENVDGNQKVNCFLIDKCHNKKKRYLITHTKPSL